VVFETVAVGGGDGGGAVPLTMHHLRGPSALPLHPFCHTPHARIPLLINPHHHHATSLPHSLSFISAGTHTKESETKKGYKLPRSVMTNADVTRLINSDEVQSIVNAPKTSGAKHYALKKNPLKNLGAMIKLNPHAASTRR